MVAEVGSDVVTAGEQSHAILDVQNLVQDFVINTPDANNVRISAVAGVSFSIMPGETFTLVGESGCGKSSLARAILQTPKPTSGKVQYQGTDLVPLNRKNLRTAMRGIQAVFQDPFGSLDPLWKVNDIVAEPLIINKVATESERRERVAFLLDAVGLDINIHGMRRPRELSGGQCQRVAIARALALHPSLLICDEPVSALDVSVQAQILNLFEKLRSEFQLSYFFITHDLSVAKRVSDTIAVMYLGKIVEEAPSARLFRSPRHPYTAVLLSAIPSVHSSNSTTRIKLSGYHPSAADPPSGCRFRTRCPFAQEICAQIEPEPQEVDVRHRVACHFPLAADMLVKSSSF